MKSMRSAQSFRLGRSESGLERPRCEETTHLLEEQVTPSWLVFAVLVLSSAAVMPSLQRAQAGMSDGYMSSPGPPEQPDSKVRFSKTSREEVSLYGTPKEEMGPVNSSR